MKELQHTQLWPDVKSIIESKQPCFRFKYEATIHTKNKDYKVLKVLTLDIVRDYTEWYGDYIYIEIAVTAGEYIRDIFPNVANIEISLTKTQLYETGDTQVHDSDINTTRYKAVFLDENFTYKGNEQDVLSKNELDLLGPVTIQFQLLNKCTETLRLLTVSGVFSKLNMKDFLFSTIANKINKIVIDGKPSLSKLDIVEPNNKQLYTQIVIPSGTKVINLPTYLQNNSYGIYNGGIGTYIQKYKDDNCMFIYPLTDTTRFSTSATTLVIYSAPRHRLYGVEKTCKQNSKVIYIIATADKYLRDTGESEYMNKGVGFRMTNSSAIMKKPVKITEEGPVADRSSLNYEVSYVKRDDNVNYSPKSHKAISSNPFTEYSKVLQREGARVVFTWQNSNPDLIYPGMPCKYVFLENDDIVEYYGNVTKTHTLIQAENNGLSTSAHTSNTSITLHVRN